MQGGRPATVAVAPQNQYLHPLRLLHYTVWFLIKNTPNLNRTRWPPIVAEKRRGDRRSYKRRPASSHPPLIAAPARSPAARDRPEAGASLFLKILRSPR